jgi:acetyl esterase/lipase
LQSAQICSRNPQPQSPSQRRLIASRFGPLAKRPSATARPKTARRNSKSSSHPLTKRTAPPSSCPGGGYIRHVTEREGYPIAQWLNEHGIACVILEYRLPELRHQVPLLDAQRAIRLTRANAAAWKINPQRIGILGFSAGGHVASTALTHFNAGDAANADPIERLSCRPDFGWLVYPVVTMGEFTHTGSKEKLIGPNAAPDLVRLYSNELQVTAETPPTFLAHAIDDKPVPPENSRQFVAAMKQHNGFPSNFSNSPPAATASTAAKARSGSSGRPPR